MVKLRKRHYRLYNKLNDTNIVFDNTNYVISNINLGSIEANLNFYAGAGQYGSTITNRQLGTREIILEGYIITDNDGEMRKLKQRFETVILPLRDFELIVDDKYKLTCSAHSSLDYSSSWFENNQMICKFSMDAICSNPFFETLAPINGEITSWIKDFHFPRSFPQGEKFTFGHQNPKKVSVVENIGDAPSGIIVSFKAINGEVINPWIKDANTGEYLYLETTIGTGEEVQLETTYGNKSITNITTGENLLAALHLTSTFIQLPQGKSTFTFGCNEESTGTLQCFITYVPKFVVV